MKNHTRFACFFIIFTLLPSLAFSASFNGTLEVVWGDTPPGSDDYLLSLNLVQGNGSRIPLKISHFTLYQAGGVQRLKGKNVTIETASDTNQPFSPKPTVSSPLEVESISLSVNSTQNRSLPFQPLTAALSGSQRYVSIMCKFADINAEPQGYDFFNNMYGNGPGQLGHYWQEVSSNNINLSGSRAYGGAAGSSGWYTLPHNRSHYVDDTKEFPEQGADLDQLFNDCVAVADAHINFSNVKGINLMFNGVLDCCAWGGGRYATLDGIAKVWPTTWNPTWAWANVGVIAHEMGHSFGLPHSNNSDEDANPYDSPWTVMSSASSYNYSVSDSTYGERGQHLNAYEKDDLGWLTSSETFVLPINFTGTYTVNLHWLSNTSAGSGAYRTVIIPTEVTATYAKYYTIEARQKAGAYEAALPATAVIIHSVDTARREPSWVIDEFSPASNYADSEGVIWLSGETFEDSTNDISIGVLSQNANGFVVRISKISTGDPSSTAVPWPVILDLLLEQ